MSVGPQTNRQAHTNYAESSTPNLDRAIQATPLATITRALQAREANIEDLLPDFMKGQGKRLIARARQYWARSDWKLQQCTEASFIGCVLQAAELGFAIDGRLCYAVPFSTRVKGKTKGEDRWENKAQLVVSYRGLLAVAKRHGLVQDGWSRVILPTDHFTFAESDGRVHYEFSPDINVSRDKPVGPLGVLTVCTHKDGWFRADFMPMGDVEAIRNRSKGYKKDDPSGPWATDPGEMAKKTGLRRMLKTFDDDPGLLRALELDEPEDQDKEDEPSRRADSVEQMLRSQLRTPTAPHNREDEPDEDPPFHPPTPEEVAQFEQSDEPKRERQPGEDDEPQEEAVQTNWRDTLAACQNVNDVNAWSQACTDEANAGLITKEEHMERVNAALARKAQIGTARRAAR